MIVGGCGLKALNDFGLGNICEVPHYIFLNMTLHTFDKDLGGEGIVWEDSTINWFYV